MAGSSGHWSTPEQYALSNNELRLIESRNQRRIALKNEYRRIAYNPYKNMSAEGGVPFDPLFQRFASTRADFYPYFKPNRWNFGFFMCSYVIPLFLIYKWVNNMHLDFEHKLRNGEIPWRYRTKNAF